MNPVNPDVGSITELSVRCEVLSPTVLSLHLQASEEPNIWMSEKQVRGWRADWIKKGCARCALSDDDTSVFQSLADCWTGARSSDRRIDYYGWGLVISGGFFGALCGPLVHFSVHIISFFAGFRVNCLDWICLYWWRIAMTASNHEISVFNVNAPSPKTSCMSTSSSGVKQIAVFPVIPPDIVTAVPRCSFAARRTLHGDDDSDTHLWVEVCWDKASEVVAVFLEDLIPQWIVSRKKWELSFQRICTGSEDVSGSSLPVSLSFSHHSSHFPFYPFTFPLYPSPVNERKWERVINTHHEVRSSL